eukprot:408279-Alexandrium_andersonii.AAC.1
MSGRLRGVSGTGVFTATSSSFGVAPSSLELPAGLLAEASGVPACCSPSPCPSACAGCAAEGAMGSARKWLRSTRLAASAPSNLLQGRPRARSRASRPHCRSRGSRLTSLASSTPDSVSSKWLPSKSL